MADQKDIDNQKNLNSEYAATRDILVEVQKSLGKQRDATKEAAAEYRKLEGIAQKLLLDEEEIIKLTDKQIQQNRDKAVAARKGVQVQAERLMLDKGIVDINHVQIGMIHGLTDAQKELLSAAKDGYSVEQDLVNAIEDELGVREDANKLLGTSGEILKGINAVAGNFGKAFGLDKVQAEMERVSLETAKVAKELGRSVNAADKLKVAAAGVKEGFSQLGNNLLSPTVLLTNMLIGFNKVDKAATDFQQQTGQDLNTMSTSLAQFNGGLVTSAELIEAASDVTKEFGINATAAFGMEDIGEIASMKKELGLSSKEASKLAGFSKLNAGNVEATEKGIISGINSANRQNKMAVSHGQVLRDVANVSSGIAITYAGFPEKLGEAAAAARGLGMNLEGLDKIAGSLLDFQSSIEAEMQAELLTGQALNLEKARELALNNDLAGVANELANQGITSAKFSQMNRLAQEAQAKALGMSRNEMADMLIQQGLYVGMSEKGLSDAQKVALEDMKRVDTQEKFATAIAKLQQALAPIVGFFADIASNSLVIYSVMGVALLAKIPMLVASARGLAGGFGDAWKNAKGLASGIGGLFKKGGIKEAASKIKSSFMPSTPKVDTSKVNDLGKKTKPGAGKGIKENLQGLAAGLRSMGKGPVAKGALNLGLFGIMAIPAMASLPFLLTFGTIPLKQLENNFLSLASGLIDMSGTMMGSVALGVFGVAATLGLASLPFLLTFGTIPLGALTANFTALSTGLIAMAGTYAGIGALSLLALAGILMIPGSVGLALFGGASYLAAAGITILIPALIALGTAMVSGVGAIGLAALIAMGVGLGISFTLIGAGAMMMGKGIQFAADGFATLFDAITFEKVALLPMAGLGFAALALGIFSLVPAAIFMPFVAFGLGLLGLALLPLGIAVEKLAPNITTLSSSLLPLAAAAPDLFTVGASLGSIALGLTAISLAGFFALPIIGALTALGAVSGGLSSIFGGSEEEGAGSKKKESEMSGVEAKLDKLISIVEAGGDVFIDGNKVGKTIQLSSSKMG